MIISDICMETMNPGAFCLVELKSLELSKSAHCWWNFLYDLETTLFASETLFEALLRF